MSEEGKKGQNQPPSGSRGSSDDKKSQNQPPGSGRGTNEDGKSSGFSEPPGTGRGSMADDQHEDAAQDYVAPADVQGGEEEAEMQVSTDAFSGISSELLDAKRAIEQALRESVSQRASTQSIDSLSDEGNIQGVAIGLGDGDPASSSGEPGAPSLTIYVAESVSLDEVKAVVAERFDVSAATEDLPMNVVVTGLIDAQPHRFRMRPAAGGISVAHFRVTAGTIGCLCIGRNAPRNVRLMVLSNNHVLANSNSAAYGDCVAQPGPYDGGRCPADQIAILERFVPINFSGGTNYVDCATAWCWPDRVRRELCYVSGGSLRLFRISSAVAAPALGMIVGKTGRTTQLTQGRIAGIGATIRVNYGGGKVAIMADQIDIRSTSSNPFSAGGDSGSSVWAWTATRNPVGLLFAGGGGVTFANRMSRVVAALDVNLVT